MIPEDDRGLLLSDGLFETILAQDGVLRRLDRHLDRLARGCAILGLAPPDPSALRAAAEGALAQIRTEGRAAVRLTVTAGSGRGLDRPEGSSVRLIATAFPAPPPQGPVTLATVGLRRNETSPASRIKSLSYLDNVLARRQARALGAEEAVMLNTAGELACAAAANLFWIAGDRLFTPALACGVLDGITRAEVLAAAAAMGVEAVEARAGLQALEQAQAVFLTNSLIGLRLAAALDGRSLAGHPLVDALSSRCR